MPLKPPRHRPPRPPGAKRADQRPSASRRGYDEHWKRVRAAYLMANPLCVALLRDGRRCGRPATDVDHHVSLEKGGTHDESNLRSYCHSCHAKKSCAFDGSFGRQKRSVT